MSPLAAAYLAIAILFGYWMARMCYQEGGRDIPKGSTGWSLIIWITHGLCWPVLVLGFLFYWTHTTKAWKRLGRLLFGSAESPQ